MFLKGTNWPVPFEQRNFNHLKMDLQEYAMGCLMALVNSTLRVFPRTLHTGLQQCKCYPWGVLSTFDMNWAQGSGWLTLLSIWYAAHEVIQLDPYFSSFLNFIGVKRWMKVDFACPLPSRNLVFWAVWVQHQTAPPSCICLQHLQILRRRWRGEECLHTWDMYW